MRLGRLCGDFIGFTAARHSVSRSSGVAGTNGSTRNRWILIFGSWFSIDMSRTFAGSELRPLNVVFILAGRSWLEGHDALRHDELQRNTEHHVFSSRYGVAALGMLNRLRDFRTAENEVFTCKEVEEETAENRDALCKKQRQKARCNQQNQIG